MLTWPQFRNERPDLADSAHGLFYLFGVGLGFLATIRPDGGPRVHPMCPIITDEGLYAFLVPSPKLNDLKRDARYALHGFPPANNEDAIYLTGNARIVDDGGLRESIAKQFFEERAWTEAPPGFGQQSLVEFLIDSCLLTRTTGHGDHDPQHTIWHAS
jgi:hypothetical protein